MKAYEVTQERMTHLVTLPQWKSRRALYLDLHERCKLAPTVIQQFHSRARPNPRTTTLDTLHDAVAEVWAEQVE